MRTTCQFKLKYPALVSVFSHVLSRGNLVPKSANNGSVVIQCSKHLGDSHPKLVLVQLNYIVVRLQMFKAKWVKFLVKSHLFATYTRCFPAMPHLWVSIQDTKITVTENIDIEQHVLPLNQPLPVKKFFFIQDIFLYIE